MPSGTVTLWIAQLKNGDRTAAQHLWERYFKRLVGLARGKLGTIAKAAVDEEDVALSAFASFCRRAEGGFFAQLQDRDDLWRLLLVITTRKARNLVRQERRPINGGGKIRHASALPDQDREEAGMLAELLGDEPTPAFAAQFAEEFARVLAVLKDETLSTLAVGKMEGYTNEQLAERFDCSLATIERKIRLIRTLWGEERSE